MIASLERLTVLISSSTPLLLMETLEEPRALTLIRKACAQLDLPLFEWSIADGLQRVHLEDGKAQHGPVLNTQSAAQVLAHIQTMTIPAVFVLKDFHRHMEDAVAVRRLRQVAREFSRDRRTLILMAPAVPLPAEMQNLVEYLDLPLPDAARLEQLIGETFNRLAKKPSRQALKATLDKQALAQMAQNLRGLTEEEAERAVAQVIVRHKGLVPQAVEDVLQAKKDILRRADMLEYIDAPEPMSAVGGLDNLKQWLRRRRVAFDGTAQAAGLEPPRGVILMGVQGCGKSLAARAIAAEWKLPLLRFDTAAIYDKYVGETEKRLRKLFRVAEQLAPCVLWVDEMEKMFAGSGPERAAGDSGVSARMLGSFLAWLQERRAPVFVAATSNNVAILPPELVRKGRFDEIFFVDLPSAEERRAIFELHLKRRQHDPANFDLAALAGASEGYSGAEIEAAIQSAQYAALSDGAALNAQHIVNELKATVPLSASRAEDIATLRAWARTRAVPASAGGAKPEGKRKVGFRAGKT